MTIVVRTARPADDAALAAIDASTWTAEVSPAPVPPPGSPFFDERTVPASVLVAEVDGAVAGYVTLGGPAMPAHAHVVELRGLAVDPGHLRRGVGRALLAAATEECRRRGAHKITLRVLAPNTAARRLYGSAGFVEEGCCAASSGSAGGSSTTC